MSLPLRQELPLAETWDLSLLYQDQAAYEVAVEGLKKQVTEFEANYAGTLGQAQQLEKALADYEAIQVAISWVSHYGSLAYETDKLDAQNEANAVGLDQLFELVGAKLAFLAPELSALDEAYLREFSQSDKGKRYAGYLNEVLRLKPSVLSKEVEELLSSFQSSLYNQYSLYGTLKFQDLTFDDFQVAGKTYPNSFVKFEGDYEGASDYELRHASWKSFHDGLARYQHTAAANYLNYVQTSKKEAKLRGFDSIIDYELFKQDVSREAYNRQIDVIMSEFAPVMRRYARLLAAEQGLDKVSLADIKMPFSKEPAETISIEASRAMVEDTFKVLGPDYQEIVRRAFDERWIDYPMNQTKSTGGFCATVADGPSYILLNWTGLLSEVLVLAHELGHAGHFQLTNQHVSPITPEASLYFIEAPSTANEVIMCQYLLSQPLEAAQKRTLIAEFIARTYFHNMVTHLLEAHFQRKVLEAVDRDDFLNTDSLNQFFLETLKEFWGDALEINPGAELTWMRQPHYFMALYPYTYSAGLTIGTAVGQKIAAGDQTTIDKWLEVLKAGGTMGPLALAEHAGVSMADAGALRSAIGYVDHLLDQIEALA